MKNLHDAVNDGTFNTAGYWKLQASWGVATALMLVPAFFVLALARWRVDRLTASATRVLDRLDAWRAKLCRRRAAAHGDDADGEDGEDGGGGGGGRRGGRNRFELWVCVALQVTVLFMPLALLWGWGMHAVSELKPYGVIVGAGIGFAWPACLLAAAGVALWHGRGYSVSGRGPWGTSKVHALLGGAMALLFLFELAVVIESGVCPAGSGGAAAAAAAAADCRFSFVGASYLFLSATLVPLLILCSRAGPKVDVLWQALEQSGTVGEAEERAVNGRARAAAEEAPSSWRFPSLCRQRCGPPCVRCCGDKCSGGGGDGDGGDGGDEAEASSGASVVRGEPGRRAASAAAAAAAAAAVLGVSACARAVAPSSPR